jgi:glycosyltransferase involved in cell wall biosynthesis
MELPLVSVLMTAYNREKYIAEAIESVLSSTYQNWELIIVDDCSKDRTVEIAKSYEAKDSRIKVYINEKNLGDYPNRNKAASYASGKYIKYLDSDDLIYPYGLKVMVNSIEMFPEAALAISVPKVHDCKPYPFEINSEQAWKEHFLSRGLFNEGPTSLIFNRKIFMAENGFQIHKVFGDFEILARLAAKYKLVKMQPSLTWWRQHPGQEFNLGNIKNEYFNGVYLLSLDLLQSDLCPLNESDQRKAILRLKQHHARKIFSLALGKKQWKLAYTYFRESKLSYSKLLKGFKPYI